MISFFGKDSQNQICTKGNMKEISVNSTKHSNLKLAEAQILKSLPPILQSVQINIKEPFIGKLIQDSNLL